MHVYLAAACPQCRSTTMVLTNQDDAWGKDHAINCGVCGRRVIEAGLTGRGLQWHGSIDPEVWANRLWDFAKRVCDKVQSGWFEPFEHQVDHRYMNPGLTGFWQFLVVLAEPSASAEPGQRPFNHPSARQHLELVAVRSPAHHLQQPSSSLPSPRHQPTGIGRIRPDDLEPGEPAQQLGQHQPGPVPVLDVGGVNHHGQEQPGGVHYDVALAPGHLFAGVVAARPPFSVVLTDWLSMIAPLGVASRSSLSRTMGRSASKTRSQVPSLRHFRKYHQTVPQGGQVVGHHSPGNTATQHVQDAVHHLPKVHGSGVSLG